jgi:hypothetical protein
MDVPLLPNAPTVGPADMLGVGDLRRRLAGATPAEAAKQLEALFATVLVKELRRGLPNGFSGPERRAGLGGAHPHRARVRRHP